MKQSANNFFAAAIAAGLLGTGPATAGEESLPSRAASMLGDYIAQQGNAALIQIRKDLKKDLTRTIKPFMPPQTQATSDTPAQGQAGVIEKDLRSPALALDAAATDPSPMS